MHERWNHSVVFRFTVRTFLWVLCVSVLFILAEGYYSYRLELSRLNAHVDQIEESHVPSIVSSLWLMDYELLNRQLAAIERFPYIHRVVVTNDEGEIFQTREAVPSGRPDRTRALTYTRRGTEIAVGRLELHVDAAALRAAALGSEILSALGHLTTALLAAAVVAVLFRRHVGRHIESIAAHAQKTADPDEEKPFHLDRRTPYDDELAGLVEAINTMRRHLLGRVRERELLMRELHHRIKNDMGFVTALLSLQAGQSTSQEVRGALEEAGQRVSVMAEIYKGIYSGSDLEEVDLSSVIGEVVKNLQRNGLFPAGTVALETEQVTVPVRISVAFGIIANELLTNAAKYSTASGDGTRVTLGLRPFQLPGVAELMVQDTGKGFPERVLRGEQSGFGLTIIGALVEQYGGTITVSNNPGATVVVRM
jgi:two-component sensor histidine kinase